MGGDDACTSCSPWRRRLGGLKHDQVVTGRLAGWVCRFSDGSLGRGLECLGSGA
jgi:hypothetical protein